MGLLSLNIVKRDGTEVVHTGSTRDIAELILVIQLLRLSDNEELVPIQHLLNGNHFEEKVTQIQRQLEAQVSANKEKNLSDWSIKIA
jgi:hypothetical protein